MPTLHIEGIDQPVTVDDNFLKKNAYEQQQIANDISKQYWANQSKSVASDMAESMGKKISPDYSKMSVGEQALTAAENVPGSAEDLASDVAQPFIHPVQTAENIGAIGKGVMQHLGIMSGEESKPYADAVGKYLMDRYGGWRNIQKTAIEDPVGLAADIALLFTGGGSILEKAGKAGGVVNKVGRAMQMIDPASQAIKLGTKAVGRVASDVLGTTTGAGGEAIRTAYRAGAEGGEGDKAFVEAMRGQTPTDQVVDEARSAVSQMKLERGKIYEANKAKWGADTKVLDFNKVDSAINKVAGVKKFKGQVINKKTSAIRDEITEAVDTWKKLDPKEYHTAEGLDALKQQIGDIRDATQYGTPDRYVADSVYQAIRKTIASEVPQYAKAMKGYERATAEIKEIEHTLSLKPNAPIDSSLRKITSALRNNVSTNYGRRAELIGFLVRSGAPHLLKRIAGMSLNAAAPRGIARAATPEILSTALGLMGGGLSGAALGAIAALPAQSPRLVGELAHLMGKGKRYLGRPIDIMQNFGQGAFNTGRSNP